MMGRNPPNGERLFREPIGRNPLSRFSLPDLADQRTG